jgi:hypothetical protein
MSWERKQKRKEVNEGERDNLFNCRIDVVFLIIANSKCHRISWFGWQGPADMIISINQRFGLEKKMYSQGITQKILNHINVAQHKRKDFNWFEITEEIFICNSIDIVDMLNYQWICYWFFNLYLFNHNFHRKLLIKNIPSRIIKKNIVTISTKNYHQNIFY